MLEPERHEGRDGKKNAQDLVGNGAARIAHPDAQTHEEIAEDPLHEDREPPRGEFSRGHAQHAVRHGSEVGRVRKKDEHDEGQGSEGVSEPHAHPVEKGCAQLMRPSAAPAAIMVLPV